MIISKNKIVVLKNSFVYWIGQFANKLLIFFLSVFIANRLGPENFGRYSFVVTIISFFWLLTDAGLSILVFREVSKDKNKKNIFFINSLLIKLILSSISIILIVAISNFINLSHGLLALLLIYSITIFSKAISSSCESIYNAYEEMEYSTFFAVLSNIIVFVVIYFILSDKLNLWYILSITSAIYLIVSILNIIFLNAKHKVLTFDYNSSFAKYLLSNSIPLMLAGFIGYVAFQISIPILSKIKTDTDVGFFTASFRIVDGLILLPTGFANAIFPHLSRSFDNSFKNITHILNSSLIFITIVTFTLALLISIFAKEIITIFYGVKYLNSILPLKIMIWSVVLISINSIFYQILIAANKNKLVIILQILCFLIIFTFNYLLIIKYSYLGASISVVLGQLFSAILFFVVTSRHIYELLRNGKI